MDTIGIKYKIPKLDFNVRPAGNQTFELYHRLMEDVQDITEVGWVSDGDYITDNNGNNINDKNLIELIGGFDYQIKLIHKITKQVKYFYFRTGTNLSAGDSPYYNKVLFPNQTYDWFIKDIDKLKLPDLQPIDWYYSLMGHKYIDVEYDAYYSMQLYGIDSWFYCISHDIPEEKYMAFHCDHENIIRLPYKGANPEADHSAYDVFYNVPDGSSFGFSFFLKEGYKNADILSFRKIEPYKEEELRYYTYKWSVRIPDTDRSKAQVIEWDRSTGTETIVQTVDILQNVTDTNGNVTTQSVTLDVNKWYNINIVGGVTFNLYDQNGDYFASFRIADNPMIAHEIPNVGLAPLWEDSPIIFGDFNGNTEGLCINRVYNAGQFKYVDGNIRDANIQKIMANYKFYPIPGYYKDGVLIFKDDISAISVVTNEKVSVVVKPDIISKGLTAGPFELKLLFGDNEVISSKNFTLVTPEEHTDHTGFDIDFEKDYDAAMTLLKENFVTKHGTWGGYNGGTNSNLVYGNGKNALILENHGDNYNGSVAGVAKESEKGTAYDGYGGIQYYNAFNDARKGQIFKTRVGSVLVSSKYFGYGEMTIRMLIPAKTYGIAPALWFFHYQEYSESDNRYQGWIDKGWPKQGNAQDGYYTVVNNEIDIELPSHNVQGEFNNWTEVANAYFDPKALDTQYCIALKQTATNPNIYKVGTFRLKDVANPNLFESWEQIAFDYNTRIYPNYASIKFNNWQGELNTGGGFAESVEDYQATEKYLALMTRAKSLNDTFADNMYHDYTIKWYPDRTELWIDNTLVRTNKAFVPFNVMKYTVGGWFPSMPKRKVYEDEDMINFHYEVVDTDNGGIVVVPGQEPVGTWAGINADFEVAHLLISKIKFTPYNDVSVADLMYNGESFPESGLREII